MNENQENNLNGANTEIPNTNPVEQPSVVTPEPVDTVSQPASVAPVTPVETQPATPVEPVQLVTPVQPVVNPAPTSEVTPNKKKSNPIIAILLVIVLLGVCGYGLYAYTDIFKPKTNNDSNNTTTTTTTAAASFSSAYKSLDEYFAVMTKHENDKSYLIQETDDFALMDFGLETRCVNDGDKVEFKIGMSNISYTCIDKGYDELYEGKVWEADVNIDNKITIKDYNFTECADQYVYTSGNYFLVINVGLCVVGSEQFTLYDYNGNVVLKEVKYSDHFVKDKNNNDGDIYSLKLLNDSNVLYFMSFDSEDVSNPTTCRLKAVNLGITGKPEIQEIGTGSTCYYNGD